MHESLVHTLPTHPFVSFVISAFLILGPVGDERWERI